MGIKFNLLYQKPDFILPASRQFALTLCRCIKISVFLKSICLKYMKYGVTCSEVKKIMTYCEIDGFQSFSNILGGFTMGGDFVLGEPLF